MRKNRIKLSKIDEKYSQYCECTDFFLFLHSKITSCGDYVRKRIFKGIVRFLALQNYQTIINRIMLTEINKTLANDLEPFEPTHPGEILKDELDFIGLSQRQLALRIEISYSQLNEILNTRRPLSPEIALLIEAAIGLPAEPLLTLQAKYNLIKAKRDKNFMTKLQKVASVVATL